MFKLVPNTISITLKKELYYSSSPNIKAATEARMINTTEKTKRNLTTSPNIATMILSIGPNILVSDNIERNLIHINKLVSAMNGMVGY